MYMSYCRYEGTLQELRACLSDVDEHINEEAEYEVSCREIDCFQKIVRTFANWMQDNELLDEYGEVDEDRLEAISEAMKKAYQEDEEDGNY